VRGQKEPQLAFRTWQGYLAKTYGSLPASPAVTDGDVSDLEVLFLKHTYLASVARLLIWASFSRGKATGDLRTVADQVLSGQYFHALKLANLVEDDFFQWVRRQKAERSLAPIWERVLIQMLTYDLAHLGEDVLKGVYQELVDPADRHDLGEYYTPDWLCERIVAELLPAEGTVSILDPSCGSGSLLRAAIAHLRQGRPSGTDAERLQRLLDHVVGIDIHPVAVTISRATYVLALGPLALAAKRPIYVPVYLADSLFLPTEVRQADLVDGGGLGYEVRIGGRKIVMPTSLVTAPDLFDRSIAACAKVALDHARSKMENRKSLGAYVDKEVPSFAPHPERDSLLGSLWKFTEELADLIRGKENSIWAFIVRNGYRPAMLKGRFDFIVGNPPWLSYRFISDIDYQEEVKFRAVEQYGVAPTAQRLVTQMELATVFLAHCLSTFGRDGAKLGFVMPRSVLSADQHAQLRTRSYRAPLRLLGYWDLREVRPLFNVPACVLFAEKAASKGAIGDVLPVKEWTGQLPRRDVPWALASQTLSAVDVSGRIIFLGDRTAFSTHPGRTSPNKPSIYAKQFHDGATIYPRSFYFVRVNGLAGHPDPDTLYWAETDPGQAEEAKAPYKDVRLSGNVEGRFLYTTALARHLLPFSLLTPVVVLLPVERAGTSLKVRPAKELRADGFREVASWMETVEKIWSKKRGPKADRESVYGWLDYQGKLTAQRLDAPFLVLYNVDGTNVSAVSLARGPLDLPFVVDYRMFYLATESQEEADYLAAVLNAESVNDAIKPFQTLGLLGERHVSKKVLDLPIPQYKQKELAHRELAALGAKARIQAATLIKEPAFPASLAQRRGWLRERLSATLEEIDKRVIKLI
jgi:SAM-dependent methyltransferase